MNFATLLVTRATRATLAAFASVVVFSYACTEGTPDNFTSPPPGPPSTCAPVAALPGCVGGALSYACTTGRPDDGDATLVCDRGMAGVGTQALYCCAPYGQWATACSPATTIAGCGARSMGFSCLGATTPDQADPSLVCSQGLSADGGATTYCCAAVTPSSAVCRCGSFSQDAGACGDVPTACAGAAIGFTCAGEHSPVELNPLLDCAAPDGGADGSYCCHTP